MKTRDLLKISPTQITDWIKAHPDLDICAAPRWTPVAKGLPEIPEGCHAVTVLATFHDKIYEEACPGRSGKSVGEVSYSKHAGFQELAGDEWVSPSDQVIAWIYPPVPYEGE